MHLHPGRQVDRYIIEGPIGEGAMAVVYRARHEKLGTEHAIKVLTRATPDVTRRLLAEGRAQARLRHAHIVNVTDVIEIDGQPGLVMEYVHGPTLGALIADRDLSLDRIDALATGILDGARFAHRNGLIHRDLKPSNILVALTPQGPVPKILDFGLVKFLTPSGQSSLMLETGSGVMLGTPFYMAPEQFDPSQEATSAMDVWALGVLLYELVTGERPFGGRDLLEVNKAIQTGAYTPVEDKVPELPARMARAIRGALQTDVSKRWRHAGELAGAWAGDIQRRATLPPAEGGEDPWTQELRLRYQGVATGPTPLHAAAETLDPGQDWPDRLDTSEVPKDIPRTPQTPLAPPASSQAPMILGLAALLVLALTAMWWFGSGAAEPELFAPPIEPGRPPPAQPELPAATVEVRGVDPSFVRLKDERGLFPADRPVPAGIYTVLLRNEHGEERVAAEEVVLVSGTLLTLRCKPKTWTCQ